MSSPLRHFSFMQQAIEEGLKGRDTAPPNPWVGCVIVKDGQVIGRGHHHSPGNPHAEPQALQAAGPQASGATAYVTLEPCNHTGRTPPCTEALIAAGIQQVVVGLLDPDPRVRGSGIRRLREAGIEVIEGVCGEQISDLMAAYLHQRRTGLPWVVVKTAMSLDGRTAAADGSSQWITCPEARQDVHRLRAASQAIMVGADTAIQDQPALTAREVDCAVQPLRVLIDSRGRVPASGPLFDADLAPTCVFTTQKCSKERQQQYLAQGAEVVVVDADRVGRVDLVHVLKELADRGVLQLMVEGGATLHSSLLAEKLTNQLAVYMGPKLLGLDGHPAFHEPRPQSLDEAARLRLVGLTRLGDSVRMDYRIV